jgi:N-acetylglucosaminyl-diphospho-decaprenol L-rhamnosyltransferase
MTPWSVSAVVVHYRGGRWLPRCVDSCLSSDLVGEVLVVDNEGIGLGLRQALPDPRIRIVEMARNVGYGTAANVGLSTSHGEGVLVLNQDTELTPGAVDALLRAGGDSGAWLVGPRLVDAWGREAEPKEAFPAPLEWRHAGRGGSGWRERPWISGAAMLFTEGHTDLRFDERLFMYAEDEELCWRVWSAGGRVVDARDAVVVHHGGSAAGQRWGRNGVALWTVLNRARFVRWHAGLGPAAGYAAGAVHTAVKNRRRGRGRRV